MPGEKSIVLLVDDEVLLLNAMRRMIGAADGLEVLTASTVAEARAAIDKVLESGRQVDVLVSDGRLLQGESARDVIRLAQEKGIPSSRTIVYTTGLALGAHDTWGQKLEEDVRKVVPPENILFEKPDFQPLRARIAALLGGDRHEIK
ncbi:hypothetical protein HZA43_02155 [Candidatus Peregrinibacteria bacterium]|nr:hypothetical protein [Candidatus Peregrinibacteria bacterium]